VGIDFGGEKCGNGIVLGTGDYERKRFGDFGPFGVDNEVERVEGVVLKDSLPLREESKKAGGCSPH
jgi:hypothetical protein